MKDIDLKDSQIINTNQIKIKTEEIFSSFKYLKIKNKKNNIKEKNNKRQNTLISGESTTISQINTDYDKEKEKDSKFQRNLNLNSNNLIFDEENEGLNIGKNNIGIKEEDSFSFSYSNFKSKSIRDRYKIFNKLKSEVEVESYGNFSSSDLGNKIIKYIFL